MATLPVSAPKDYRVREIADLSFREADDGERGILTGLFGPLNEWVEINSVVEGHFMERFGQGSYEKTFSERASRIRCLHRHGRDPLVGQNPIGKITSLYEGAEAAHYEVELFEGLPPLILAGYRDGQYGSSHTFKPVKQEFVARPRRSEHNPTGLPEVTYTEVYIHEFGPCPFPIYSSTTAAMRSATDDWILERFAADEEPKGHATASITHDVVSRDEPVERLYSRTLERIGAAAWAMHPDMISTVVAIVAERARGVKLTDDEIAARIGTREDT